MRLQTPAWLVGGFALLLSAAGAPGQGTFQNLDFEAASLSGPPQVGVPISIALPGWSAFFSNPSAGTTVATTVWYDSLSLGGNAISLMDASVGYSLTPIQGAYSVLLFGGGNRVLYSAGISQTGLVPSGARTLLVDVTSWPSGIPPFSVTLDDQPVNMVLQQTLPGYARYGGDITSFAGRSATLSFIEPPAAGVQPSMLELDHIAFSGVAIPEPGVFGLSALGALVLGWRVLRRRR